MFRVKQEIGGNDNKVAGRDIIHNQVHVEIMMPEREYPDAWCHEIERHREFKREVGIDCSYPARRQICNLLTRHNFTSRQIRVAWKNNTLFFDDEKKHLGVVLSRGEVTFGLTIFIACMLSVLLLAIKFFLAPDTGGEVLAIAAIAVVSALIVAKLFIEPNQIGRRLERILKIENDGVNYAELH